MIKMEFPFLEACLSEYSFVEIVIIMCVCTSVLDTFQPISCDVLSSIINKLNRTTCGLDPFPTQLLMSHLSSIINIILRIVNLCFSSGVFPASCKSAIISPSIKNKVWILRFRTTIGLLQICLLFQKLLKRYCYPNTESSDK